MRTGCQGQASRSDKPLKEFTQMYDRFSFSSRAGKATVPHFSNSFLILERRGIGYGRECDKTCQVNHVSNPGTNCISGVLTLLKTGRGLPKRWSFCPNPIHPEFRSSKHPSGAKVNVVSRGRDGSIGSFLFSQPSFVRQGKFDNNRQRRCGRF